MTAQEQARASADRLLQALDLVPQGIVFADASGALAFTNRAAATYIEARHGDALVGSAIDELVAQVIASDEPASRTLELFGPPRRALQLRAVPLAPDGGATAGVYLVVEDVSERQRLEAVRRDFVANISHELKTPVGALSVLAETLVGETDPATIRRLADRMQSESGRVAQTIDELLELSRIESGDADDGEQVRLHEVLAEAVDRTRHAAEQRDAKIEVHPVEPDLVMVGDRRQLVTAVSNLVHNGIKFSDPGGTVGLSARAAGGGVEIEVADRGIGIPASAVDRIFERFYRVDQARSRNTGGTGLGLAIVNHVVQNHHGTISVTSHEGEGSTFVLRFPRPAGVEPPVASPQEQ
ncbi:MAG: PAS domain-containing protein [Acidimicrobiales bacterium]|nr:PAS domain-containing protein [Acidimicrobiales bacterium]